MIYCFGKYMAFDECKKVMKYKKCKGEFGYESI